MLIQNREFLRYLRHDPHFQRAIIGQHQAIVRNARHYPLPPGPPIPILLSSSRFYRSPNGRLFNRKERGEWTTIYLDKSVTIKKGDEMKPAIPEGPLIGLKLYFFTPQKFKNIL